MKLQNWMIKAFVLGAVFFIAAWIVKPVGVSTQFSVLSGIIHSTVDPEVITTDDTRESGYQSSNVYYDRNDGKLAKEIKHPFNYNFIFVLAIPLGGYVGSRYMKRRNKLGAGNAFDVPEMREKNDQIETCNIEKSGFIRAYGPAFIGGFLLLYGARMADGCTSGHMMSGMMQGSISGYLFAASVFAVAIPVAIYLGKRARGGRK